MWLIDKSAGEATHFVEVWVDGPIGLNNEEAGYWARVVTERMNNKGLNAYDIVLALQDHLVGASDDADGYMQGASEEVKAKQRKEIEAIEEAIKILLPYAKETAETLGLRADVL